MGGYLANPHLTHIVFGGDGDIFSIGGGHLPHVARRNPKITVFVLDNEIYGTDQGAGLADHPADGQVQVDARPLAEQPLNPAMMCLAYELCPSSRGRTQASCRK